MTMSRNAALKIPHSTLFKKRSGILTKTLDFIQGLKICPHQPMLPFAPTFKKHICQYKPISVFLFLFSGEHSQRHMIINEEVILFGQPNLLHGYDSDHGL